MNIAIIQNAMLKQAGIKGEIASSIAQGAIGNIHPVLLIPSLVNGAGGWVGAFSSPASEKEEEKWDEGNQELLGLVPGVNGYRLNRRVKRQFRDDKGGTAHFWSSNFGGVSAMLLATALLGLTGGITGAAIGAGTGGKRGFENGLAIGGLTGLGLGAGGSLLAETVAPIAALIKRRRTKEEQKAYANTSTGAEWSIPGVGSYNKWKALGRAIGDSEEREEAKAKNTVPEGAVATA